MIEYQLTTPPSTEPLTLAETKAWLKVDHNAEDTLIQILITAARERCESITGLSLMIQQWTACLSHWPIQHEEDWWDGVRTGASIPSFCHSIPLRHGPIRQINAFNLYDQNGNATLYPAAYYALDKVRDTIVLQPCAPLPRGERVVSPIEITYTTGHEFIPSSIKAGLLKLITHLYEHRGDEPVIIPSDILALWQPYRKIHL